MTTDSQLTQRRDNVKAKLKELLAMPVKDWAMRQDLGAINFAAALPAVDRTMGLFGMLDGVSLDFISFNRLQQLANIVDDVINHMKQVEAFTLQVGNPAAQRDQIVQNIQNAYNNWFEQVFGIVGFAIRSSTDFAALERDLRTKIAQAEVTSKELLEQQKKATEQAQETLTAIRKAAAEAGVSKEATHFAKEAAEHQDAAKTWLGATVLAAALLMLWGITALWFWPIPPAATTAIIVQHTLGKAIVLWALSYALVWTARNYGAARHNYIVNKHRQNSLSTFETFVKAAGGDQEIKNAVLLQATTSIFTAQPTGYSVKDAEPDQPNKIIEIIRGLSPAKSVPG